MASCLAPYCTFGTALRPTSGSAPQVKAYFSIELVCACALEAHSSFTVLCPSGLVLVLGNGYEPSALSRRAELHRQRQGPPRVALTSPGLPLHQVNSQSRSCYTDSCRTSFRTVETCCAAWLCTRLTKARRTSSTLRACTFSQASLLSRPHSRMMPSLLIPRARVLCNTVAGYESAAH